MDTIFSRLQAARTRIQEAKAKITASINSSTIATNQSGNGASNNLHQPYHELDGPIIHTDPTTIPPMNGDGNITLNENGSVTVIENHSVGSEITTSPLGYDHTTHDNSPHDSVWDGSTGFDNNSEGNGTITQDATNPSGTPHDVVWDGSTGFDNNSTDSGTNTDGPIDWGNPQQDGLDVYNEDLSQSETLGDTVTSDAATAGQSESQQTGQQVGNTQIDVTTTDDTTSFSLFNDSVTVSTGSTTEVEEITSLQPNGDTELSNTTTTQSGVEVSGTTLDNDAAFDTGVTGSVNGGVINQTSTTNSGSADGLESISENGQLGSIADNAGNMPAGTSITETEGTGIAGGFSLGAEAQSTVNSNDGLDLEGNPTPGVDFTANIGVEGSLSGEGVNSNVNTVSRPGDEAGTDFHTENVETGTQQTTTFGLGVSGNASMSAEFGSGTSENPQTSTISGTGSIQGEIEVQQTTSNTQGANYNLTEDNDQSQQQQQHLETGIPSVVSGQHFTESHTVETSQTLQGGHQVQVSESTADDDFLTHSDEGSNVTSTSNQAIQSTNTQSTTVHMTSETGNQTQDGSAPTALPDDSQEIFTNTTTSTSVNTGNGAGSVTYSDDGTSDGPMITVEGTGTNGQPQSTGGMSPDEYADLANQAAESNPDNDLLSNADPANIGDSGLGQMGNVFNSGDTQQGINSMLEQTQVNAQNTTADNQLIEQAQQQETTTPTTPVTPTAPVTPTTPVDNGSSDFESEVEEEEEGDDTVTNTNTEINDDESEDESDSSSSSGCFLTTSACEHRGLSDDCHELTVLRGFRDTYMDATPDLQEQVREYYRVAPEVVDAIQAMPDRTETLERMFTEYIRPSVEAIERGENTEAYDIYVKMLRDVQELTATHI